MDRLDEIRARVEAVSAGPWQAMARGNSFDGVEGCGQAVVEGLRRTWHEESLRHRHSPHAVTLREEDAEFVAHARQDIPYLLDRLDAMTAEKLPDGQTPDTYEAPDGGWVCFHCGVRFMDSNVAAKHFGGAPGQPPDCKTRAEAAEAEVTRLGKLVTEHADRADINEDKCDRIRDAARLFTETMMALIHVPLPSNHKLADAICDANKVWLDSGIESVGHGDAALTSDGSPAKAVLDAAVAWAKAKTDFETLDIRHEAGAELLAAVLAFAALDGEAGDAD